MKCLILLLLPIISFAQTKFSPITDESKLAVEAMSRSVFIRAYTSSNTSSAIRSTGIILKGGYIITNEHVIRPHIEGKNVAFHIYTNGKKSFHKFTNITVLGCDPENDICLLKSGQNYGDAFFSLESPSFRQISTDKPIGLFKDEMIFFNGFCNELPRMAKAKYVAYTNSAYEKINHQNRKYYTQAIQFSSEKGESIACGGDSGGPLFDSNLFLYGMVRDSVRIDGVSRDFAVPITVIRAFLEKTKNNSGRPLRTISSFSELETIFKK